MHLLYTAGSSHQKQPKSLNLSSISNFHDFYMSFIETPDIMDYGGYNVTLYLIL